MLPTSFVYAEEGQINISFNCGETKYNLDWDTAINELPSELDIDVHQNRIMPLWGDPSKVTENPAGYYVFLSSENNYFDYSQFTIESLILYYSYLFVEDGYIENQDYAPLYMARYSIRDTFITEQEIETFINQCNDKYGEPIIIDREHTYQDYTNSGWVTRTAYDYDYQWVGDNNTALRFQFSYDPRHTRYENCTIYVGRSDFDSSLREGKLVDSPAFIQALVAEAILPLYNDDGSVKVNLDYATPLLITGYNAEQNMFNADVVIVKSQTEISGVNLHSSSWYYSYNGLIDGYGLNIDRDELLNYYLGKTSKQPSPSPLEIKTSDTKISGPSNTLRYVLNTHTMKFHDPSCSSIYKMSPSNRLFVDMTREEVLSAGYSPCQICNP